MASVVNRSILHMNQCPMCGYDVSGLPRRHQCPECGFAYDEDMCVIVVDVSKPNRFNNRLRQLWFVPFIVAGVGSMMWNRLPLPCVVWAVVIVAFAATVIARRVVRKRQGGDSKLWFQREGVAVQTVLGKWELLPWRHFERLRLWQVIGGIPTFTRHDYAGVTRPAQVHDSPAARWRVWIQPGFLARVRFGGVDFQITCTATDIEALVEDLRKRINAAKSHSKR